MQIREATENDIPAIVKVLKASLGETDLPLSEEIWNFKHVTNPFGKSLVLVATEGEEIIGVRAFMRWKWQLAGNIYSCFRAVDTATHPSHQGKGIFKKLTLKAVEIAKEQGDHFIFNTPNEKSRPGYLKMGWEPVGKINVALMPSFFSFWKLTSTGKEYKVERKVPEIKIDNLCDLWNTKWYNRNKLFTPKSSHYLIWRFENNPLQKYEVIATDNFYLAAYVKNRGKLKELRISECIFTDSSAIKLIKKSIFNIGKKHKVQFISFSPSLLNLGLAALKGNFGPILTLRNLNLSQEINEDFLDIDNWNNSLGDLELF